MAGELEDIRRKHFPSLPYKVGPSCKECSSEQAVKVLEVCANDEEFPTANSPVKKLLEDGRYHEVYLTPKVTNYFHELNSFIFSSH